MQYGIMRGVEASIIPIGQAQVPVVQTPLMQASVTGHVPQVSAPPQPSGQSPQTTPDGHAVAGVHVTHLPPTHAPVVQVPQSIEPPQPSG